MMCCSDFQGGLRPQNGGETPNHPTQAVSARKYSRFHKFTLLGLAALLTAATTARGQSDSEGMPYTTWNHFAGSADSMQYSALAQINKTNIHQLELAWFLPAPGPGGRFSFNPLVIDDRMYVVGKDSAIFCLDAATGAVVWSRRVQGAPTNRGFSYWASPDHSDRRLIFSAGGFLQQLDAQTGTPIRSFGKEGLVDLREGLGRDPESVRGIQSGTPGRVFENLIILGSAPGEGYGSPPGDIRAYEVLTGKLAWTFRTIPRPGDYGYETWPPDAWQYAGGANCWGGFSIDEPRGIAYIPLGSPTYDLYGADRHGANLFGNSLVALDARTGKRLWHFQTIQHDLWDYDLTASPNLLTVQHNGKPVDIVAQAGKTGFLYVFNRVTGEPLWPIEDRPVPGSDIPGEEAWPTQPFPTRPPPFSRQAFPVEDINPYLDPDEAARLRTLLLNARNEGIFTPPTHDRDQIQIPWAFGGANWGSTAGDPETGMLYVRTWEGPGLRRMQQRTQRAQPRRGGAESPEQRGLAVYTQFCLACHSVDRQRILPPREQGVELFTTVVRQGKGEMPGFADILTEQDVNALIAYLNSPAAAETPPAGDAAAQPNPAPPSQGGPARYSGDFGAQMLARNGLPANGPPWAELVAYDLNQGTIKWRVPVGTIPGLAEKGITDTGSFRPRNGPVVTAGGLIFLATQPDRTLRAFDKDSGEMLWHLELEANPDGIPAVYEVDGRQYVAFFAAYMGALRGPMIFKPGKPEAQGYYVFALPEKLLNAE